MKGTSGAASGPARDAMAGWAEGERSLLGVPGWRKGCRIRITDRILRRPSAISFLKAGM